MKKKLLVLLAVIMVLLVVSIPALADPPENAEGVWGYFPVLAGAPKEAGCNTFLPTYDDAVWTGTFEGEAIDNGTVVIHCNGKVSYDGTSSFVGEVNGESGTLEMSSVGKCCDENGHWKGQWVILSGTGGLATLRGQGTWFGPGAGGLYNYGEVEYEGNIHFEP